MPNGGTGLATVASGAILVGAGTSAMTAVPAATTNNVLTANGSAWVSGVPQGGPAPVVTIYTSPSPWTKSPTLKAVKITVLSGGGGGARQTGGPTTVGGGGSSGAYGFGYFPAPSIPGPVTVTVGAGGIAVTGSGTTALAGNAGGTSSFGALISATGASGGALSYIFPAGGAITPSPTVIGGPGFSNPGFSSTGTILGGFRAASNNFGTGGEGRNSSSSITGFSGTGFGVGGGGVTVPNNPGVAGTSGAGSDGFVIVEEFY